MTLLGTPLLIVLGLSTAAAPALVYVLWSRLGGSRRLRVVVRLAMVAFEQIVAVLLVAAVINDYGYFFQSWSELGGGVAQTLGLGSDDAHPKDRGTRRLNLVPASAGRISAHFDVSYSTSAEWKTRGRLESVTILGAASRLKSHAYVYLPPQYFQPRYAHLYFPGAEVFAGYPGTDQYLVSRLHYPNVLLGLLGKHLVRPMVLVMMRPAVTFPRDTECTDVPAGPQAETFFGGDVPAQVANLYRVRPTEWGAIGDSTGGYCATKVAMFNPDVFGSAVEMSGYFFALRDHTTGDLWGGSRTVRRLNDLKWRLEHMPAPPVSILVGTSRSETGPDGYAEAKSFVRLARAPMTVDVMTIPNGGHNFATWRAELAPALTWLSAKLPAPGVSSALTSVPMPGAGRVALPDRARRGRR